MHGGVLIVLGSLTARTDKLARIFNIAKGHSPSLKTKISFWNTWFVWVILPSLFVFFFLFLCYLLVPLKSSWFIYGESFYRECVVSDEKLIVSRDGFISTEKIIFGIPIIFEGILTLRLIRQLMNLDGLEDQYDEYSQILCVLLVLGLTIAAICIVEIIAMNPYTKDTFQIGLLLAWYYSVQAFMFWPRFWRAFRNHEIGEGFIKRSYEEKMSTRVDLGVPRSKWKSQVKPHGAFDHTKSAGECTDIRV